MWALVINPVSGHGKGTTIGTYVAGYLNQHKIVFTIVTGNSSIAMGDHYFGGLICREGAGGKPDPEGLSYVNGASTAFLDAYLNGNAAAKNFLHTADLPAFTNNRAFLERNLGAKP